VVRVSQYYAAPDLAGGKAGARIWGQQGGKLYRSFWIKSTHSLGINSVLQRNRIIISIRK